MPKHQHAPSSQLAKSPKSAPPRAAAETGESSEIIVTIEAEVAAYKGTISEIGAMVKRLQAAPWATLTKTWGRSSRRGCT